MLDIKEIRNNPEVLKNALIRRKDKYNIKELLDLDEKRREILYKVEQLKSNQNTHSKLIPKMKKEKQDISSIMIEMKKLADEIKDLDNEVREVDHKIEGIILSIPNIPNENVPHGYSEADNREIKKYGNPREFSFEAKPHWEIGENLDILDFARAGKITGARFTIYKGVGARLERALINFMLDLHIDKHGYIEILPPFLVNRSSMQGTGQLPKFEEDAFKVSDTDYYLVPTAEVPITNMYRDEILDAKDLPILHTAYTACFRAEAGAAGRDTRGLIRQHQFNKVELVKFTLPENSYIELEKLTNDAEEVLQLLQLPYRVIALCDCDLGFSSAMTYDIEAWMPSYNRYVEISSCSNFETFQARRAGIRFRRGPKDRPEYVHTLNGSGLAIGRTTACILETYQNTDGSVTIPEVLRKYMNGASLISDK